ncbi:MAG: hypothetical protein JKY65_03575 [Planctomycetes bacterium]|nr:hypothetical protein [Planctomycetota bacterium]
MNVAEELADQWSQAARLLVWNLTDWRVCVDPNLGSNGNCNLETQVIGVTDRESGVQRLVSLVHEGAHAIARSGHGQRWKSVMDGAIGRCEDSELRLALEEDLERYVFTRETAVPMARDLIWSGVELLSVELDTAVAGVFTALPEVWDLYEAHRAETKTIYRATGMVDTPRRISADPRREPAAAFPERNASVAAARRTFRLIIDNLTNIFGAPRADVLSTLPEVNALLADFEAVLPALEWPELEVTQFSRSPLHQRCPFLRRC